MIAKRSSGHFDSEQAPRRKTGPRGVYRSTALQPHERLLVQSMHIPGINHTNPGNTKELARLFHCSLSTIKRTALSKHNKWNERTNRPVDWDRRVSALLTNLHGVPVERAGMIEAAVELIIPAAIEYGRWAERNEPTDA